MILFFKVYFLTGFVFVLLVLLTISEDSAIRFWLKAYLFKLESMRSRVFNAVPNHESLGCEEKGY